MDKAYHPSYTSMNPASEARRYTSQSIRYRKVTQVYDWLDPERDVASWVRWVPYRLENGDEEHSWIVKYFEFRAGIPPIPQVGFIGDLWVSHNAGDPSVWFKVDQMEWERWGGCASSARGQMNAKHPFLEKAFLWFAPKDYFSADEPSEARPSLQWEQIQKIRRMAPMTRIIDLDSKAPPKRPTTNPVHLPSVRMIVHAMCSVVPPLVPTAQRRASEEVGDVVMGESSGGGRGENIRSAGPFPMEDFEIGDDVEIDWSDWGENTDDEADNEQTEVENSQQKLPSPTLTPSPKSSRYHPYQFISPLKTQFTKFKPPQRYITGALGTDMISPGFAYNTPVSPPASSSSTVVNPTTNFTSTDDKEMIDLGGQEVSPQDGAMYPQKPSQRALQEIVKVLREDGHDQPGMWALLPELSDAKDDLAAKLLVPILDLGSQTLHRIRNLLRQDGFSPQGILVLNVQDPGGVIEVPDVWDRDQVKNDVLAWI